MPDQDVTAPESSPDVTVSAAQPGPEPVSSDQGLDRPVENAVAEFNRKFARLERSLENLSTLVATNTRSVPEPTQPTEVSDDDLWRLAQQGDRGAFDVYMQRVATRTSRTELQGERHARLIDSQLVALAQKYPVLHNTSHPLTQTVQMAYQLLLGQGYPAQKSTLLEAVKTAIADRPDLVSELHAQSTTTRDMSRQSATQVARAGQTGAAHRDVPASPPAKASPLSQSELALAKRMSIKDPAGAKKRFLERQARGESNLGQVANFVNEEEL